MSSITPQTLPIDADHIADLDFGGARVIINKAIVEAITDLEDRAVEDRRPRKVTINVTFDLLENGSVAAKVDAVAKVPPRRAAATVGELHGRGRDMRVVFRKHNPEDPGQSTIEELDDGHQGAACP